MSDIRLLDDITIQQIAAGEIIDRPAAIVKEIIENSMDAHANTITLEIKNGGKSYIRVTDNGSGIKKDDIELAFQRHSTSKLKKADDLYNINSFGFRGEALASIAAVAKLELLTKTRDETGSQSFIENSKIISTEPVGCPNGTTIIMKDIFYNFPVRRDFLKSDLVESNRITDTVTRLALGNPSISFKYIKDGRVVFKTPGKGDLIQTIYSVLGKEFNDNLVGLDYSQEDFSIKGFISKNSFYRSNRSHQYLYVNNRFIKNTDITNIVEAEYRSLIPINRYPIFFLFIDLDPSKIDVNIHPTKEEINFVDEGKLLEAVGKAIGNRLRESLSIQEVPDRVRKKEESIPKLYESSFFDDEYKTKDSPVYKNTEKKYKPVETPRKISEGSYDKKYNVTSLIDEKDEETIYEINSIELEEDNSFNIVREEDLSEERSKRDEFIETVTSMRVLGIVFKTYILAEDTINKNLIMIDQHAAHERIMYEYYLKKYKNASISTQLLMSPEVLELTDIEFNDFKDNMEFFKEIGFDIDFFGGTSIIIRGTPIIFGKPEASSIFYDILDNIVKNIDSPYEVRIDKIMKMACTSAIKSGDSIVDLEIEELLKKLMETDTPFTCPHGRPTIIKMSQKQIEKDFKRIM